MVVRSIDEIRDHYCTVLGYEVDGPPTADPEQRVRVQFLRLGAFVLELIEPAAADSPVSRFLQKGGGIQHVCYECDDLDCELDRLREHGAGIACPPVPAVAIGGRRVAFVVNRHRQLIELVESDRC